MAEMERRQEESMFFKSDIYRGRFTSSYVITQHRVAMNVYKVFSRDESVLVSLPKSLIFIFYIVDVDVNDW